MSAFTPRPIRFHGFIQDQKCQFKCFSISYENQRPDWDSFSEGLSVGFEALEKSPLYPEAELGFLIAHKGQRMNYLILAFWGNDNELFPLVLIQGESGWHVSDTTSFCVWDMEVMFNERNAYIKHVMNQSDHPGYLSDYHTTAEIEAGWLWML